MAEKIFYIILLLLVVSSFVIIIIANTRWDSEEKYCDEDCKNCPFPPCSSGKRNK